MNELVRLVIEASSDPLTLAADERVARRRASARRWVRAHPLRVLQNNTLFHARQRLERSIKKAEEMYG